MLTNEEKKVAAYEAEAEPTVASRVTPDTPLHSLNLNWREEDLPEKERTKHVHRLHPYLGKFIPQLVEVFMRKFFEPGQTVLDPFCGSCSTLVQANELGIDSVGYDVSAFNVLLGRAKTMKYDLSRVRKEVLDVLEKTRTITQREHRQLGLWRSSPTAKHLDKESEEYLKEWFAPQALNELLTYRDLIESGGYEYQDLLKVILSRSARSARMTTHFDLDFPKRPQTESYWCYKHSRKCSPTTGAFKFLERYSVDSLRRIEQFAEVRTNANVTISQADSRNEPLPVIHGVITSPPYVGLIDYHEQHAYAYHLLGLEDRRQLEIGPASNGSSQKAKATYQDDIALVFRRVAEAMDPGGRIIVVAGDRSNLYGEIARQAEVDVETVLQRHVNRRTGRRSGEFYESIFIWRKR